MLKIIRNVWLALFGLLFLIVFFIVFSRSGEEEREKMSSHYVIAASARHTATVIFLHGLGDTGQGWSQLMKEIRLPHVKYICPTAATMPVSLNAGFRMPSWFDILSLAPDGDEDKAGINKAKQVVSGFIEEEERNGIASNRIILGGFSQGGALSLYSALTSTKQLGGIVALSSWLPLHKDFLRDASLIKGNRQTPVFQAHGDQDFLVSKAFGDMTAQFLKSINPKAEYEIYPGMAHASCGKELEDMKKFIQKVIPE